MLPLFYNDDDFYIILWDKIGLHFAVNWIVITCAFLPLLSNDLYMSFLSPLLFILLKFYSQIFVYRSIKYHDEGNAFVSRSEFFALHITFSFMEAWLSYLMLFSIFQAITNYMNESSGFEKDKVTQGFGIFAMVLMLWELTYYLAYYKDIIFAFFNCIIFSGIFYRNYSDEKDTRYVMQSSLAWFIISAWFF